MEPSTRCERTNPERQRSRRELEEGAAVVNKATTANDLKDAITIINEEPPSPAPVHPGAEDGGMTTSISTIVYTDDACNDNDHESTAAGSGVWYGDDDPRNIGARVSHRTQSNQTGELMATLIAVKNSPSDDNLRIISDSKYAIDGLAKNVEK